MTRNTERRIEIACPVLDADLKQRIYEMLEIMLADNTKAWELFSNGRYVLRRSTKDLAVDSQDIFTEQARVLAARNFTENEQNAKNAGFPSSVPRAPERVRGFLSGLLSRRRR
jgi:polyphosphate kinase